MTRTCKYKPCSKEFEPTHWRQEFCGGTCRANHFYAENPEKRHPSPARALPCVATHPLDDARGQVEEGKTASDWALAAREYTMRTLLSTGYFTADDLAVLGIPEHYRKSVHGLVTAYFRGPQPYMEEAGRRKSERPERKGAKNTIFRITAKGRAELPKLLEDTLAGSSAGEVRGSSSASGEIESGSPVERVPQASASGATLPAPGASPEPLSLLPEPPSMFDPDQRAA